MKKLELEFPIKSSIKILYNCLSTPSGLSEWFCDDVNLEQNAKHWNFSWDGSDQVAELIQMVEDQSIRFRWLDEDDDTYFEFKIDVDDLTGNMLLVITDFTEEDEVDTTKALWDSQVRDLLQTLGS